MSAKLAQKYGVPAAKTVGDLRERILSPAKEDLADEPWDVYKDMWNNEAGRRIGLAAVDNRALVEAIKDAWRRGDLIAVRTDGRILKNYRYAPNSISEFDTSSVRMKSRPDPPDNSWDFRPR